MPTQTPPQRASYIRVMRGLIVSAICVSLCALTSGCGRLGFDWQRGMDAGHDAAADAAPSDDGGHQDARVDAGFDSSIDGAIDDASHDANIDDANIDDAIIDDAIINDAIINDAIINDATIDAGTDAEVDASTPIDPTYPPITLGPLSSTGAHTCTVRNHVAYCWGSNTYGELGLGDTNARNVASVVTLPNGATITQISAGEEHTCAIEIDNGAVWCWGRNNAGQLGLGDRMSRDRPVRVPNLPRAIAVSAGYWFTCAITEDNALWCWGLNTEGQLGLDDGSAPITERDVPTRSGSAFDWIQIGTGQGRTCGLRHPGTLWCTGRNAFYGFGTGNNTPNEVRAWTRSGTDTNWTVLSVSQDGACGLRSDLAAYCWGTFATLPPVVLMSPGNIAPGTWRTGAAGVFNVCGITQIGAMVCWGRNTEGQLGTGDTDDRAAGTIIGSDLDWVQVVMGRFHTCAQKQNGSVYCTGENMAGQLGLGDMARRNVLTQIALP